MKPLLNALLVGTSLLASPSAPAAEPLPQVAVGRIERIENFPSKFVAPRHVDVWLPRSYSPARRHAVIYMHDGQMLFDAGIAWNHQAWNVQDTAQRLIDAGRIRDVLIVGIWNTGTTRHAEYFPQKWLPGMPELQRSRFVHDYLVDKPQGDAYLRFLVEELKPLIDARYATRPDAAGTFVMGSSMGGLISVYAMSEYPAVFGAAAGLSTHWTGNFQANAAIPLAAFNYLRAHAPDPATHRLYLDRGTVGLDALYAPYQPVVDELLREAGYVDGRNFETRVVAGADHTERDWGARVEAPLLFLLGGH